MFMTFFTATIAIMAGMFVFRLVVGSIMMMATR